VEALGDDWFGISVRDDVATINDAIVACGQAGNLHIGRELAVVGSPRYEEVVGELVRGGGMPRADAERLVQRYTAAEARMRQDRDRRTAEVQRQQAVAEEAERRKREELARAAAAERARVQAELRALEAEAKRLRERLPVVHCFGGCERTAHYWSPCSVAPRQIGWVDKDGTNFVRI
jgi:hypothetical protein